MRISFYMAAVSGAYPNHHPPATYVANRHRSSANHSTSPGLSPFVQRIWISLEFRGLHYQYIEVDPYKKPESLLRLNPRGLVPALEHGDWSCYESSVLMEYVGLSHPPQSAPLLTPLTSSRISPPNRASCQHPTTPNSALTAVSGATTYYGPVSLL